MFNVFNTGTVLILSKYFIALKPLILKQGRDSVGMISSGFHIGAHALITCNHMLALNRQSATADKQRYRLKREKKKNFNYNTATSTNISHDLRLKYLIFGAFGVNSMQVTKRAWLR